MQSHNHLVTELIDTIELGGDPMRVLEDRRDHLSQCQQCQKEVAILAEEIQINRLVYLEEMGLLDEPPSYPVFQPPLESQRSLWQSSILDTGAGTVRELVDEGQVHVKVSRQNMAASFEKSSVWLWSTVTPSYEPALSSVPGEETISRGQVLTLPDSEENLLLRLTVEAAISGRSHLSIEMRQLDTGEPIAWGRVRLQFTGGEEVSRTGPDGKAIFLELEPGRYSTEILPDASTEDGRVWRFAVTLESA